MSGSSLWGITIDGNGVELEEYQNSWLYAPIVWKYLYETQYTEQEKVEKFGPVSYYMMPDVMNDMWKKMIDLDHTPEQVNYFVTMEYVFFAKDIPLVAKAIREVVTKLELDEESSHIAERFEQMAKDIEALDVVKYPYFVFKNTSVDDNVERWFEMYIEEPEEGEDDYKETTIFERKDITVGFVIFEDGHPKAIASQHDIERVGV